MSSRARTSSSLLVTRYRQSPSAIVQENSITKNSTVTKAVEITLTTVLGQRSRKNEKQLVGGLQSPPTKVLDFAPGETKFQSYSSAGKSFPQALLTVSSSPQRKSPALVCTENVKKTPNSSATPSLTIASSL